VYAPWCQNLFFFFPRIGDGLTVSNQSIFWGYIYIPSGNLLQFAIEAMAIIEIVDLPNSMVIMAQSK
jgi:hypothetical protein